MIQLLEYLVQNALSPTSSTDMKKDTKLLPRKLWEFGAKDFICSYLLAQPTSRPSYCACPHFVFRSVTLLMSEEDWRERPPAWWQVTGLSGCCKWNWGLGRQTRKGGGVRSSPDPSLLRQDSLPATAGRLREELFIWPCMIAVLCCLKWTSKISEADKEPRSGKIAGGSSVFSIGHYADYKFSLQSDLLTKSVLLCCSLSAQRYVNIIKRKTLAVFY